MKMPIVENIRSNNMIKTFLTTPFFPIRQKTGDSLCMVPLCVGLRQTQRLCQVIGLKHPCSNLTGHQPRQPGTGTKLQHPAVLHKRRMSRYPLGQSNRRLPQHKPKRKLLELIQPIGKNDLVLNGHDLPRGFTNADGVSFERERRETDGAHSTARTYTSTD